MHVIDDASRIALVRIGSAFEGDNGPSVQFQIGDHLVSSHVVVGRDSAWID
ncbi:MAG: hypothetical protein KAR13_02150 [Desulfobulbaceae bacterium]|nr:hypothetical protein [Desulfobulbaceae bacterium]